MRDQEVGSVCAKHFFFGDCGRSAFGPVAVIRRIEYLEPSPDSQCLLPPRSGRSGEVNTGALTGRERPLADTRKGALLGALNRFLLLSPMISAKWKIYQNFRDQHGNARARDQRKLLVLSAVSRCIGRYCSWISTLSLTFYFHHFWKESLYRRDCLIR